MPYKILFSNIGYAKGIDGSLRQHMSLLGRHLYCALPVQEQVLGQVKGIISAEKPDLCCFVEIDMGSPYVGGYNQIGALLDMEYRFHDVSNKYGRDSWVGKMPMHQGRANAFLARQETKFERLYFAHGTKRLVYRLSADENIAVYFAHFSLNRKIRTKQFEEVRRLTAKEKGEIIILADFNIIGGFEELKPLLWDKKLRVLNKEEEHTFTFHTHKYALDLCLASEGIADRIKLKIIPQPFSDHAALLAQIN